jgi:N-methylhydantoinase B/oxoprolinase/acetone carboxylase alpha subunit
MKTIIANQSKTAEEQIKELEAQIAALKKEQKVPREKRTVRKQGVVLLTASARDAKLAAETEALRKQLRKLLDSGMGESVSPTDVVDAYIGGLSDLPDLPELE